MSTRTPSTQHRLTGDARKLLSLTQALALSGSRLEDNFWEDRLAALLRKILGGRTNRHVENVLDSLVPDDMAAYEILVELAETHSESTTLAVQGTEYDALLFAAPVLVWTRYQLPLPVALKQEDQQVVAQAVQQHLAADGVQCAVLPQMVSFEQMPQSFQDTARWTQQLAAQALGQRSTLPEPNPMAHTEGMLADARFIVGVLVAPRHQALFKWQTQDDAAQARNQCLERWSEAIAPLATRLYTGCTIDVLQPEAFYVSSREADKRIRPLALKSAALWLQNAAHLGGSELRAAIIGCGENTLEEYRIGFTTRHGNQVIYGCVWPILSKEEAAAASQETHPDIPDFIAAHLAEVGITHVKRLGGMVPGEICDDCGAPFFPNSLGEMMHPELPDEINLDPVHLH